LWSLVPPGGGDQQVAAAVHLVAGHRGVVGEQVQPLVDLVGGDVVVHREAVGLDQARLVDPPPEVVDVALEVGEEQAYVARPRRHSEVGPVLGSKRTDASHRRVSFEGSGEQGW
jgi:hypothetical protein